MIWRVRVKLQHGRLSLNVDLRGDVTPLALVGPNGCGKTTLLRTIAGAHRPDEGRIEVQGVCWFDSARGVDVPVEGRQVGYVPQGYGLFPHLRALDNVAFGLKFSSRGVSSEEIRKTSLEMLEALGASSLASRFPHQLSGGERQKIALARTLILSPRLLLLDEPLAALDVAVRRKLRGFLAERLRTQAVPALVVTHELRDVVALGARVCVMEAGSVVQEGSVEELRAAPVNDFVAEFMGL